MLTWFATSAALLAATSTTTASVAADAATGAAAPAALEAAPATPAPAKDAPPPESTVTPPGSTPQGETAAPAATAEAKAKTEAPFSKRFVGSQMWAQTSATLGTFKKDLVQDYNPTVTSFLSFSPRFRLADDWQLRGRIGVSYEWTDSDITSTKYIANLTDTTLQLFYSGIPSFYGVKLQLAPQLVLPTSNASNTRTMRLSPGLVAQAVRGWGLLGGSVVAIGRATYQRPIYQYSTSGLDNPLGYDRQCGQRADQSGSGSCVEQLSGVANARDVFNWLLVLVGSWGDFAPGLAFSMSHQTAYGFDAVPGISDAVVDPNGWRVTASFSAWLDYTPLPWLTTEVGYSMSRNILRGDAQIGNPFYDRYQNAQLYLGVNIGLETLYDIISGQSTGEGGVVRS